MKLIYGVEENHWFLYQYFKSLFKKDQPIAYEKCERKRIIKRKETHAKVKIIGSKERLRRNKSLRRRRKLPENQIKLNVWRKDHYQRNRNVLIMKKYGIRDPQIGKLFTLCADIHKYILNEYKRMGYETNWKRKEAYKKYKNSEEQKAS